MVLGVLQQAFDDYRHQLLLVLLYHLYHMVVVQQEQRPLRYLEMVGYDTVRAKSIKQSFRDLLQIRARQLKDFLKFLKKQDLFSSIRNRPNFKKIGDDLLSQVRVFLQILNDAVLQLCVEGAQVGHFMERQKSSLEEEDVVLFQGGLEPIDDGAKNLEKLWDAVVLLILVGDFDEEVHDVGSNELSDGHESTVDAMEEGFEVVPLSGILGIE